MKFMTAEPSCKCQNQQLFSKRSSQDLTQ